MNEFGYILPNFFLIGAARAGTTYLYQNLAEHPEVFSPGFKDTFFFNRNYEKGMAWYASFYKMAVGYKAIGDFSMEYYLHPECAERIRKKIPHAKIVCCLREPVARVFGHYYWDMLTFTHFSRKEYSEGVPFMTFAKKESVFKWGDYYRGLKPFYDLFPGENIHVVFLEDIKSHPKTTLENLFNFLEVDRHFKSKKMNKKINQARIPYFSFVAELGYKLLERLKSSENPGFISALRDNAFFNKVMFKTLKKDWHLFYEAAPILWDLYHANDEILSRMINCRLPDNWEKNRVCSG